METNETKKKEPLLLNILLNIVLPVLIMTKLNTNEYLGPMYSLIVALCFPVFYGVYDFVVRKNLNFISMIGFISILLTGVFGLFELSPMWIAVKEAAVPFAIGVFILATMNSKYPLVEKLLYNDNFIRVDEINTILKVKNKEGEFKKVMKNATYLIALSSLVSSILNFVLARIILVSEPGTEEYIAEIGRMTALGYIVIALPSAAILFTALIYLFKQISKLTGLKLEEMINK